jgi:hypothetical protein
MPAELARRFERRSRTYEARALPTELHQRNFGGGGENCTPDDLLCRQTPCCLGYATSKTWSGVRELHPCFRTGDPGYCSYTNSALERAARDWTSLRYPNPRVGGPRHQPLYHARFPKTLAVATGVEPVPPDRQSGILPLDSATGSKIWLRGHDSNVHEPGQSRLS